MARYRLYFDPVSNWFQPSSRLIDRRQMFRCRCSASPSNWQGTVFRKIEGDFGHLGDQSYECTACWHRWGSVLMEVEEVP